jgi:hypothetical protein
MHAVCSRLGLASIVTLVGLPLSAQESPSRLPSGGVIVAPFEVTDTP